MCWLWSLPGLWCILLCKIYHYNVSSKLIRVRVGDVNVQLGQITEDYVARSPEEPKGIGINTIQRALILRPGPTIERWSLGGRKDCLG